MIVFHEQDGALECTGCEELTELSRHTQGAPEVLVLVKEAFATEHKDCHQYEGNPELARANRKFCAGIRAHQEDRKPSKISRSDRRPRRGCR